MLIIYVKWLIALSVLLSLEFKITRTYDDGSVEYTKYEPLYKIILNIFKPNQGGDSKNEIDD